MRPCLVGFCLLALAASSGAQPVGGDPEIRRAIPVTPAARTADESNEGANQVPIPVATPLPMGSPAAAAPPAAPEAIPAATQVPAIPVQPFRPSASASPAADADGEGSIRLGPSGAPAAASGALDLANSFYSRRMYDLAVPEYERFLISSPAGGAGRDAAMFRLAECHRILGNLPAARAGYERLVMEFRKGEFAGSGAYRLGEYLFGDKIYDAAHIQFQTAAREAKDAEVRLTALYFSARSLDYLERDAEARDGYAAVVAVEGKNPYRNHARMALAGILTGAGEKEKALESYEALVKGADDPKLEAEAAVKAAGLAADTGKPDRALALFKKVLGASGAAEWKPVAAIGAMRLSYQASDYPAVVALASETASLPPDLRAEALQLLAGSYRQTGNNLDARRTYDVLLKEFPESAGADEAQFQRLVSLYALKDKNLVEEIDAFLQRTTNPRDRTQALLLKAETLFKRGDYAGAGKAYETLLARQLSDDVMSDATYKLAWCLAATGDHPAAASVYSTFLSNYPDHKLASTALAQRALAKQESKAFESAIEDFDALSAKYPGTKEHELALQQKALILGQQQKYPEMAQAFDKLLAEFPKSAAAGQANFWLGWADFEQKEYARAIERLTSARSLDPGQYGERATLRIILAQYYLENREAVLREASGYKGGNLPSEISLWLASKFVDDGEYAKAEALLLPLTSNPAALPPDAWIQLAECQIRLGKFRDARGPAEKFLETARDPATRSRALLARAKIQLGLKQFAAASADVSEALLLQPEGRLNAEGRLVQGDILLAQSDFASAARAYMTVSVLLDDPGITPRALQKAADAYKRANDPFESEKALAELRQRYPDFYKSAQRPKSKS